MSRHGILLINLGTPASTHINDVRDFLRSFLCDPYVIDLPAPLRYLLVYAIILPFRAQRTTRAYKKIWTQHGSPLLYNCQQLRDQLALHLGNAYQVTLAMRYGNPSIEDALQALIDDACSEILVVPLFPQYAAATTQSCIERVKKISQHKACDIRLDFIHSFYQIPAYTGSQAAIINKSLKQNPHINHLVLSFHGLPLRQIKKSEADGTCCSQHVDCPQISEKNKHCYRAQCYASSRLIASAINLAPSQVQVSFQSRLGKNPWTGPATEEVLKKLIEEGVGHVMIACPSFVCDCLETLEEIGMGLQHMWSGLGGKSFVLVPCLNADPLWIDNMKQWLLTHISKADSVKEKGELQH